jgi:hypothetical protein
MDELYLCDNWFGSYTKANSGVKTKKRRVADVKLKKVKKRMIL